MTSTKEPKYAESPAEKLAVACIGIGKWLEDHPKFAQSNSTQHLRNRLSSGKSANTAQSETIFSKILEDIQKIQLAFHEAGHAATFYFLNNEDEVWDIHIRFPKNFGRLNKVGEGISGGAYFTHRDGWPQSDEEIKANIVATLAGSLFHPKIPGIEINHAATQDDSTATELAKRLQWSLGEAYNYSKKIIDSGDLQKAVEELALVVYRNIQQDKLLTDVKTVEKTLAKYIQRPAR
ncbi:hypothetical protein [Deinococcus petrolearius]|uniref:Peptidase M41 domain-containing protein n=1 Tax=Deinococcus petrolearius TaxID=1751295 RepID=A0ABW1DMY0_9DEIO